MIGDDAGLLVPQGDVGALAAAMRDLIDNAERRESFGRGGGREGADVRGGRGDPPLRAGLPRRASPPDEGPPGRAGAAAGGRGRGDPGSPPGRAAGAAAAARGDLVTGVGDEPGEEDAVARLREEGEVHVADRRRPPPGAARRRRRLRMASAWARGRWPWRTVWYRGPGDPADPRPARWRARVRRRRGRGQRDVGVPLPGRGADRLHPPRGAAAASGRLEPGAAAALAGLGFRRARLAPLAALPGRSVAALRPGPGLRSARRRDDRRDGPGRGGAGPGRPLRLDPAAARRPRPRDAGDDPLRRRLPPPAEPGRGDLACPRDPARGRGARSGGAAARSSAAPPARGPGAGQARRSRSSPTRPASSRTPKRRRW